MENTQAAINANESPAQVGAVIDILTAGVIAVQVVGKSGTNAKHVFGLDYSLDGVTWKQSPEFDIQGSDLISGPVPSRYVRWRLKRPEGGESTADLILSSPTPLTRIGPQTSDGRAIFSPAVFSGDQNINYPGAGDDIAAGTRGGGARFLVDASEAPDVPVANKIIKEWQFIDHTYIQGGEGKFANGAKTDWLNMDILAPATPSTASGGGNTGNANKVNVGGFNVYIPAAGDGAFDVDLGGALNGNLNAKPNGFPTLVTKAVPVPSVEKDAEGLDVGTGYYDYNMETGALTVCATPGKGMWNLFDAEIILTRWVTGRSVWNFGKADMIVDLHYEVPVKAKKVLAQWMCRATFHIEGGTPTFCGHWDLFTARRFTT